MSILSFSALLIAARKKPPSPQLQCLQKQRFSSARSGVRTLDTLIKSHFSWHFPINTFHIGSPSAFTFYKNVFRKISRRNSRRCTPNNSFFRPTNYLFRQSYLKAWHWLDSPHPLLPISRPLNAENSKEFSLCIHFFRTGKRDFGFCSSIMPRHKKLI